MPAANPSDGQQTNLQSILGGIFGGLHNYKSSAALSESNVKTNNPQTYGWIGHSAGGTRYQTTREAQQGQQLPWYAGSTGTAFSYSQLLPTDIPSIQHQVTPGTSVLATTNDPSTVGSTISALPDSVPAANYAQFNGYQMNPQNAEHWRTFFANQMSNVPLKRLPNPSNVMVAVTKQANITADGDANLWDSHSSLMTAMSKNYQPARQFWGFTSSQQYSGQ